MKAFNVDKAWLKVKTRILSNEPLDSDIKLQSDKPTGTIYLRYLKIAAILIFGIFISYGIYKAIMNQRSAGQELIVRSDVADRMETILPDGSSVTLNASSRIKFSSNGEKFRKVVLKGEAYFNVKHVPQKPFLVIVEDARIQVTGTSFNVYINPENKDVEVYVLSGSVQITHKSQDENTLTVGPGQVGVVSSKDMTKQVNQDENYMSWKTREFTFRETKLNDVIKSINRAYQSNIMFENPENNNCRLTATFKDESLEAIIEVLSTAFNLETETKGTKTILKGDGCELYKQLMP